MNVVEIPYGTGAVEIGLRRAYLVAEIVACAVEHIGHQAIPICL